MVEVAPPTQSATYVEKPIISRKTVIGTPMSNASGSDRRPAGMTMASKANTRRHGSIRAERIDVTWSLPILAHSRAFAPASPRPRPSRAVAVDARSHVSGAIRSRAQFFNLLSLTGPPVRSTPHLRLYRLHRPRDTERTAARDGGLTGVSRSPGP